MVTEDPRKNGISQSFYDAFTLRLLSPANVKKIDIGGGLIHGRAEDFSGDASAKVFLSHTSAPLTDAQKEIGSCAAFGQQDVLVQSHVDSLQHDGVRALRSYFPTVPEHDIATLGNAPLVSYAPDTIMQRADAPVTDVFLVLSGQVELIDSKTGLHNRESAGGLVGELECCSGESARRTCRALSHVAALRIPCEIYIAFLGRAGLVEELRQVQTHRQVLQGTWLFGEMISFPLQVRIARSMSRRQVREDTVLAPVGRAEILLLSEGLVTVFLGGRPIENLKPGGFFGEETLMRGARELPAGWSQRFAKPAAPGKDSEKIHHLFEARALLDSTLYSIPAEAIEDIPAVQWKLMETYERRLKSFRAELRFVWHDSYSVGIPEIDGQHRLLFDLIDGLDAVAEGRSPGDERMEMVEKLTTFARSHLEYEETLAARHADPAYEAAIHEHGEFLRKVEGLAKYLETAPVDALHNMVEFLKDWVIDHTLLENRRFRKVLSV
jgi:hemerythrin